MVHVIRPRTYTEEKKKTFHTVKFSSVFRVKRFRLETV